MDLRQLRALSAVAEHQSFSAAARALHTVQSNISTHIARIERELDTVLIDRRTGQLTPEGEAVRLRAKRIESELDAIEADVAGLQHDIHGALRFGIIGTTARWLVAPLLDALDEAHPGIRLIVIDATTTSLIPQLRSGTLDAALVNLPVDDPEVTTEEVFEEERIVVTPTEHPLAQFDEISLLDLTNYPLLLSPAGTQLRDTLDQAAQRVGSTFSATAEVDGMRLMASLAFQGYSPAVLPASAAPAGVTGDWKRVRVTGLDRRGVGIALPASTSPSATVRAFRATLIDVLIDQVQHHSGLSVSCQPEPTVD
ncbi:MAG: LysR family transcriptional regulator [Acidimicrobiales bacterium]